VNNCKNQYLCEYLNLERIASSVFLKNYFRIFRQLPVPVLSPKKIKIRIKEQLVPGLGLLQKPLKKWRFSWKNRQWISRFMATYFIFFNFSGNCGYIDQKWVLVLSKHQSQLFSKILKELMIFMKTDDFQWVLKGPSKTHWWGGSKGSLSEWTEHNLGLVESRTCLQFLASSMAITSMDIMHFTWRLTHWISNTWNPWFLPSLWFFRNTQNWWLSTKPKNCPTLVDTFGAC